MAQVSVTYSDWVELLADVSTLLDVQVVGETLSEKKAVIHVVAAADTPTTQIGVQLRHGETMTASTNPWTTGKLWGIGINRNAATVNVVSS